MRIERGFRLDDRRIVSCKWRKSAECGVREAKGGEEEGEAEPALQRDGTRDMQGLRRQMSSLVPGAFAEARLVRTPETHRFAPRVMWTAGSGACYPAHVTFGMEEDASCLSLDEMGCLQYFIWKYRIGNSVFGTRNSCDRAFVQ